MAIQRAGDDAGLEWRTWCPVSAVAGDQVQLLADLLLATLPEGPPLYPEGQLTDEPEETLVAEVIREAALEGMRDELPHSLAVVVEEMVPARGVQPTGHSSTCGPASTSSATARRASSSGTRARACARSGRRRAPRSSASSAAPVFLDLHVKVAKDWQRDPKQLRKLGF